MNHLARKTAILFAACAIALTLFSAQVRAQDCKTIPGGTLTNSTGSAVLSVGYDMWGYNYQARIFNGTYCDAYQDAAWCQPYSDVELEMKWNDAWLSNSSCDNNLLLDRHFGLAAYRGSGAWTTNHQKGVYFDPVTGKKQRWNYFVKIVAVPLDATLSGGTWTAVDGTQIGPMIWDEFAIIQEVYNDTGTGDHGVLYLSPLSAGLGRFAPQH
jgi:hypothetical protein